MIKDMDWPAVFKKALARGGWLAEAFFEQTRTLSLMMEGRRMEKTVAGRDRGLGLRVLFDERTAYAYTTELTEKNILALAEALSEVVEGAKGDPAGPAVLAWDKAAPGYLVDKAYDGIDLAAKAALVNRASEAAWAFDPRVRQAKAAYMEREQEVFIANSEGRAVEDSRVGVVLFCQVVAEKDGVIQTGYEPVGGGVGLELFDDHPPEKIAQTAARRAVMMLEAKPAPGGRMPVVLAAEAGGTMIHEAVGHGLEADLAAEGLSVYSDKLGREVASPLITVLDDSTLPGKRGSLGCDDEGVPAQKTVLIDQGKLNAYMTDRLYGHKADLPLSANGRRESFRHKPVVRMTNTLIAPGRTDPASILSATDSGLYVVKMGGGQVNTANGDFVFEVSEGYLIDKGKKGEPVRGATLVGSGPAVLNSIDLVGSDLGFGIGTCGKDGQGAPVADAQPTLRIPEILVGGAV